MMRQLSMVPPAMSGSAVARWMATLLVLAGLALGGCSGESAAPGPASEPLAAAADDTTAEHALKHTEPTYRCPMHPDVVRDEPGECPICGMDLVRVEPQPAAGDGVLAGDESGATAAGTEVRISPAVVNNIGVRTEAAVIAAPERRVATVGYVAFDERRMRQVQPRAEGWIEGLAVRAAGETVRAGQLLFTLYSPMLESAQQEYLDAQRIGNRDLVEASRERLRRWGWTTRWRSVSRARAAPLAACRSTRRSVASSPSLRCARGPWCRPT